MYASRLRASRRFQAASNYQSPGSGIGKDDCKMPKTIELFGAEFLEGSNIPNNLDTEDHVKIYECRQIHHTDPKFPLVPPNIWAKNREKKISDPGNMEVINDPVEARKKHDRLMAANLNDRQGCLFMANRRHYVKGAFYGNIKELDIHLLLPDPSSCFSWHLK